MPPSRFEHVAHVALGAAAALALSACMGGEERPPVTESGGAPIGIVSVATGSGAGGTPSAGRGPANELEAFGAAPAAQADARAGATATPRAAGAAADTALPQGTPAMGGGALDGFGGTMVGTGQGTGGGIPGAAGLGATGTGVPAPAAPGASSSDVVLRIP